MAKETKYTFKDGSYIIVKPRSFKMGEWVVSGRTDKGLLQGQGYGKTRREAFLDWKKSLEPTVTSNNPDLDRVSEMFSDFDRETGKADQDDMNSYRSQPPAEMVNVSVYDWDADLHYTEKMTKEEYEKNNEDKKPETVITTHDAPADLIDALKAREMGLANIYSTADEAWNDHLGMLFEACVDYEQPGNIRNTDNAKKMIAREKELRAKGIEYHNQGYRLHRSSRQIRGLSFGVPENAIDWRIESAGHIATTEASRLIFVTKILTTAQVAERLGISRMAVIQAIKRGSLRAIKDEGNPYRAEWHVNEQDVEAYRKSRKVGRPSKK